MTLYRIEYRKPHEPDTHVAILPDGGLLVPVTEPLLSRVGWEATIDYEAAAAQLQSAQIGLHGTWLGWAKIIVDAAVGKETDRDTNDTRDTWHVAGCSLPGDHLADCFVPRRNRAVGEETDMTLWKFDERWLKYANVVDEKAAAAWFANEYGVHAEGLNSLVPLVPVTEPRLSRAEWEATGIYYWVCRADGEDFTSEGQATEWGVIGCHSYRPGMYDPDEYDHDHDRCGWVVVAAVKGET